jgi:hypothetical protein
VGSHYSWHTIMDAVPEWEQLNVMQSRAIIEDGGHVVRGYSYQRLEKILLENDLNIIKVNYVTGKLSLFLYDIQTFLPSFRILKIFYIPLSMLFTRLDNLICSDNTHNHCIAIVAEKIKS